MLHLSDITLHANQTLLAVLSQDRAVYGDSIAVLTNAESQDDPG